MAERFARKCRSKKQIYYVIWAQKKTMHYLAKGESFASLIKMAIKTNQNKEPKQQGNDKTATQARTRRPTHTCVFPYRWCKNTTTNIKTNHKEQNTLLFPNDVSSQGSSEDCWCRNIIPHMSIQQVSCQCVRILSIRIHSIPIDLFRFNTYLFKRYAKTGMAMYGNANIHRYASWIHSMSIFVLLYAAWVPRRSLADRPSVSVGQQAVSDVPN